MKLNGLTTRDDRRALRRFARRGTDRPQRARHCACDRHPELSETIRVRSIVGHSSSTRASTASAASPRRNRRAPADAAHRSADLMERNLDRRVEVLTRCATRCCKPVCSRCSSCASPTTPHLALGADRVAQGADHERHQRAGRLGHWRSSGSAPPRARARHHRSPGTQRPNSR